MSMSIQTNVNALTAQENLRTNNEFQSKTIGRLTSGYRINSSGDDAAGLAVRLTAAGYSPVCPSIASRSRSRWPQCREYS